MICDLIFSSLTELLSNFIGGAIIIEKRNFYEFKRKDCYFLVQQKNNQVLKIIQNKLKDKHKLICEA